MWSAAAESWLARQNERPAPWLALFAALLLLEVTPWWSPTPDSVLYLSMARSLARTGELAALGARHTGLPPGYPLLLAPLFVIAERPFLAIAIAQWLLAAGALVLVHRWARRTAPAAALGVTAMVAVNVSVWMLVRRPLSEISFLVLLLAAASALDRLVEASSRRERNARAAASLALLGTAMLVREAAIVLAFGFAIAAWRRGARAPGNRLVVAVVAAVAVTGLALVIARDLAISASTAEPRLFGTHLDGFLDPRSSLAAKLHEGLRLRIAEIGRLLIPGMFKAYGPPGVWLEPNLIVEAVAALAAIAGWTRRARAATSVLELSAPFYLALHAAWPFDAGTRYLTPLLPVLALSLWPWIEQRADRLRLTALVVVAHLAVTLGYHTTRELPRARACDRLWPAIDRVAADVGASPASTSGLPECASLMLSFALDRPVERDAVAPSSDWLVAAGEPAPAAFARAADAPPFTLWHRRR